MNVYCAISTDGGVTFPVQGRVNDLDGDVSSNVEQPPRVAISGPNIFIVWTSKQSGASAIRLARVVAAGRTFLPAVTVHDPSLKGARGWESLAAGEDGAVRVVWLDGRNAENVADAEARKRHAAEMAANPGAMRNDHAASAQRAFVH